MKSKSVRKSKPLLPAKLSTNPDLPLPLRLALDQLLHLDIPAKGRIAYHIRMGRLHQALRLCKKGYFSIWRKVWVGGSQSLLDQLVLLRQVESLIQRQTGEAL